ncbi:hypothetical protein PC9H_009568 [Pleurotus ostreatus]|uniref:F-box domain-containing protein n=2 Tax=Pleurotus TaxID=5320 RepID=A0A8H6ZPB5_PLEOS|nr:uncharacterized protein PC9H_009568 [Pleurotus ostreatus]KAF7424262.1 hypothetical protein PC9H_009568 [Pleurotus ostreatus]KAG9224716.1 hypothetical protein CCMSSC00406_0002133 [Pleurotus cornucopiae]
MSPPSTTECPAKWHGVQAAIDKQITAYESAILELRTRRNDHAPISKLPVELLEEIFVLAKLSVTRQFSYRSPGDRGGWLNVAQVCRNWRKITLNAPRMWDELNASRIRHLDWAIASLAYSQNAPLRVWCTDSESHWAILSVILAHMDRIQHLDINSDSGRNSTVLLKIIEAIVVGAEVSPLILQSLHLHARTSPLSSIDAACEGIHHVLCTAQMPFLKTLEVIGFTLPPTIPIFSQLRQLSYTPPYHIVPSVSSILSILRSTPSLRRLEIGGALETSNEVIDESTVVELPELCSLSYTTTQFKGSSLFRQIRYPPSVRVRFRSVISDDDGRITSCADDLKALLSHIASDDNMLNIVDVSISNPHGASLWMIVADRHGLVLNLHFELSSQPVHHTFKLSLMLPRSQAPIFYVSGFPSINKEDWETLFRRHEHVQKLVTEYVGSSCIQALLKPPAAEQPPFAQLKTLQLCQFDIELNVALVVHLLEERKQLGLPIDLLEIDQCEITKDIVSRLEGYVKVEGDFVFDQDTQSTGDKEDIGEDESDEDED